MVMNATLMKRLFKAISDGRAEDLYKIARSVIEDETKKGHTQLARDLSNVLNSPKANRPSHTFEARTGTLSVLPKSKRFDMSLVTHISVDRLEHHMVLPEAVEKRFQRIEREYAARERLAQYGLLPRKKILLYGPPGCGKTMGAQRLAWNTGLDFWKVRFDAIVSSYLGETAVNLRSVFETAVQSPCLLFFDECDSIAKSRSASQEVGEIKRIVNSFLQMLDEYELPGLLVCATNLYDQLDYAIWRRFDDLLEIPKPGSDELRQLIEVTLTGAGTNILDWAGLLKAADGFSAAQIVRASKDALKKVILDGKETVKREDLLEAIEENRGGE
jgi:SpoVK/Ycf46/Vps4 family AAA+-type ATPase